MMIKFRASSNLAITPKFLVINKQKQNKMKAFLVSIFIWLAIMLQLAIFNMHDLFTQIIAEVWIIGVLFLMYNLLKRILCKATK